MKKKKQALISVYHKEGVEKVAGLLAENNWEIISTGGTAKFLRENKIKVKEVSEITRFPEILDGRVKTLHPLIFAPILATDHPSHARQAKKFPVSRIDLVIVNFYPFAQVLRQKDKGLEFMLENIDIGGPSLVRAASKNFLLTAVVVDPEDYLPVAEKLVSEEGLSGEQRKILAQKAFAYTSFYDSLIAGYLRENETNLPAFQTIAGRNILNLRYGENPHQQAALYIRDERSPLATMQKLQGKELSFNNILDLSMVYEVLNEFSQESAFAVIVKHQNPCGAACGQSQIQSFEKALAGDPQSAFGGIVGFNRTLEAETARAMETIFFEVIIAPDFSSEALQILQKKKNLRLIKMDPGYSEEADFKTVLGGFVFQSRDNQSADPASFVLKTSRTVSEKEKQDMAFGWKLVKYVKSNAILIVKDRMIIGVGAGQMSRVDSVEIAIKKAGEKVPGAVLLSDAFFPFADSVEIAASHGIAVLVEPGGSVKDNEVTAAAEKHGLSLLFTGIRHFRH